MGKNKIKIGWNSECVSDFRVICNSISLDDPRPVLDT